MTHKSNRSFHSLLVAIKTFLTIWKNNTADVLKVNTLLRNDLLMWGYRNHRKKDLSQSIFKFKSNYFEINPAI